MKDHVDTVEIRLCTIVDGKSRDPSNPGLHYKQSRDEGAKSFFLPLGQVLTLVTAT